MDPARLLASWQRLIMLDERTVQLGDDEDAVRIIGPAQRVLEQLRPHLDVTRAGQGPDAEGSDGESRASELRLHAGARRQLAAVLLEGLPAPAKLVAEELTRLNIGMLLLSDEHLVSSRDIAAGYPATSLGLTRTAAVRRTCLRLRPDATIATRTSPRQEEAGGDVVDIHVLFAEKGIAPARLADAAERAQVLLPVVHTRHGWRIGPLLSGEPGPCPHCLLLHGQDRDPHWETLQTALAAPGGTELGSTEHGHGPGGAGHDPAHPTDPASVVASIVAREVQLAVDGQHAPQTSFGILCLAGPAGHISVEPVHPHPECECRLRASRTPRLHPVAN
ncbi:hypothetical protein [Nesterenkonia halotolerans]|uniref:Bacteriocin biosynthesis cyclodehydratase domain-containing protein n=1 Tax=Nesterenkonia halotolerans TaxID=225325 RepID=A0ABR9J650_9MICC|nr:hypothetical protein [Nesterenkonia halotolerans]MBE1514319.1 hypothetical protein [Nesterenkonia halotolerans]